MDTVISQIAAKLAAGGRNLAFTGAGISTESGIADYRSQGGIWDKFKPVYFDDFMRSHEARVTYWQQKTSMYRELVEAKPNPAHLALSELYQKGLLDAVITQNIDGLHQAAGIPDDKVIELHGSNLRVRCMSCHAISSIHAAHARVEAGDLAPECDCGGYLKPDTISFGQAMPLTEMQAATALAENCDVILVVGSTLLVHPAAALPDLALRRGAWLAIVNLSQTPYDHLADALVTNKAGVALPEIVRQVGDTLPT